ncbi:MAG: polyprenyl synthetase family protein [Saprospiraceae bacterium]|nr:polyprenyl synthetase family protein [Saprospiraceae bacterium]
MASDLDRIRQFIAPELKHYDVHFKEAMKSSVPLLDKITHYIIKSKGKQIRPMFVFLSARIFGESNPDSYTAASLVELLHTATLVHDDVVDESFQRRGFFSISALWKNKVAVLVGDYLFSQGMHIALDTGQYKMLHIVSKAVKAMAEGELLQLEKARRLDIKEEIYFDIIRKKTASLIAASCSLGASSTAKNDEAIELMRNIGENIGMCFQIKDDLFDYGDSDVGKPLGIDIAEKKMTLPLIYALNNTSYFNKRKIIYMIKNQSKDESKVREVIDFVKASEGIAFTIEKMNEFKSTALRQIQQLPQNEATQHLISLVEYVIAREK